LIELPKYRGGAAMLPRARPVEKWAYFLGHVDQLEIPEIERLFQDPVFVEAGGILEMISKTEEERLRYELRMKALRDLHSNLDFAEMRGLETGRQQGREEGRREGRQEGRLEGTIQTLQQLLGEPVTNSDELTTRDREQLEELAEVLQARIRGRLA
jgi:hypothetical protein